MPPVSGVRTKRNFFSLLVGSTGSHLREMHHTQREPRRKVVKCHSLWKIPSHKGSLLFRHPWCITLLSCVGADLSFRPPINSFLSFFILCPNKKGKYIMLFILQFGFFSNILDLELCGYYERTGMHVPKEVQANFSRKLP